MQKVFIVEDELNLAEAMVLNLQMEGYEVEAIHDGHVALSRKEDLMQAQLVVLDLMLPKVDGLSICKALREKSGVPILILSAKGATSERIEGLKAGANDYLAKPFDLEELLLRIKNLIQPPVLADPQIQIGAIKVDLKNYLGKHLQTKEEITFTKREVELLELFIKEEGRVVSRDRILAELWGEEQYPTARTIDNYILSFRKIFEEDAREPRFFHSVRGVGYRFTLQ